MANIQMEQVSGYKLINKIGEGGMAVVYKGVQVSLNRPVAIKLLSNKLIDHPIIMERFTRESLIIARLNHPNIIHVIDRGLTPEGMPYFVMEFVEGVDLAVAIRTRKLSFNRKIDLTIQICKALSYAHKNGVIHRDIKPSNVLIDREENAQVLDFGIAQFYDDENRDTARTQSGLVMGTIGYMSPEQQMAAESVTVQSDLYSVGAIMYEMFTGEKPLGRFHLPSEIDATVSKALEDIIMKCLESDPVNRPASADEIKDCLLKLLRGAHLGTAQKERASRGITKVENTFVLLDVIKEESHGAVYLYENRANHDLMVIKKRSSSSTGYTGAKLLTSLKHKNIVNILGASKNDRVFIIIMEYLSGGSLKDRLIQPLPWQEVLRMARALCEGLLFAHRNRILHGNLRPSNILFSESGEVKITDFGLDEHYADEHTTNWYNVTGEPPSPCGDIFAAGVIFYQMLTGLLPEWTDKELVQNDHFQSLPLEMQAMVTTMLSLSPDSRHRNFDEVISEIDTLMDLHEKTAVLSEPTGLVEEEPSGALLETSARSAFHPRRLLLLLILLTACAAAYLVYVSDPTYMETFKNAWSTGVDRIGTFLDKLPAF